MHPESGPVLRDSTGHWPAANLEANLERAVLCVNACRAMTNDCLREIVKCNLSLTPFNMFVEVKPGGPRMDWPKPEDYEDEPDASRQRSSTTAFAF
jgi:hypothetical protein